MLRSTYTVSGSKAEAVEKYLINQFSMPKLKFVCCGWETQGGSGFYKFNGHSMSVSMYSSESLVTDKSKWSVIPKFFVEVTLYLEEP